MTPTSIFSNFELINQECQNIIARVGWGDANQIGLTHRPGATQPWLDGVGSLYDRQAKKNIAEERDFTEWCTEAPILKTEVERLAADRNFTIGRVRLMRLMPRRGLSVHSDSETRYHYVIQTNNRSYFCYNVPGAAGIEPRAHCYHTPADGQWWWADTTKIHWVYNGGDTDRIHIVVGAVGR